MQREEARMWKLEEVQRVSAKGEDPHGFNITVEGKPLVMFAYATQARAEEAAAQMRSAHEEAEVQPLGQ
jgi:hypothetical protein